MTDAGESLASTANVAVVGFSEAADADGLVSRAREMLYDVIDPEVGVNIVDLGLVFDLAVADRLATVRMTLTTPGCPLSGYMDDEIRRTLTQISGIDETYMDLVWEPTWGTHLMTDHAKRQLGWLR